jgi:hypothetical protein
MEPQALNMQQIQPEPRHPESGSSPTVASSPAAARNPCSACAATVNPAVDLQVRSRPAVR